MSERFIRTLKILGEQGLEKLMKSHVTIVGIGGVGSWAAEALARSGIGELTLIDYGKTKMSNINRQIHAQQNTIGYNKAEIMAQRLSLINPQIKVNVSTEYLSKENIELLILQKSQYVIDAIDTIREKCQLIEFCRENNRPLLVSGGAGGRMDPTQIRIVDLALSHGDPFLHQVRKDLRGYHNFPRQGELGIPCVFSTEPIDKRSNEVHNFRDDDLKKSKNTALGTMCFVTGAFGLAAAAWVVKQLLERGEQKC